LHDYFDGDLKFVNHICLLSIEEFFALENLDELKMLVQPIDLGLDHQIGEYQQDVIRTRSLVLLDAREQAESVICNHEAVQQIL
jgi:hypothetical protein